MNVEHYYIDLGSSIAKHRKERCMTQQALANKVDMARASIVNIEKGRHQMHVHLLAKIAFILGQNIIDLIPPNEPMTAEELINTLPPDQQRFVRAGLYHGIPWEGDD